MDRDVAGPGVETLSTRDMPLGTSAREAMEACWRATRRGARVPRRRDIDPGGMEAALPHAFVLERVAPGVARLRVAGQAIAGYAGGEARGLPISALFSAEARPALGLWTERCFGRPAIVELPVRSRGGAFRAATEGRLLLLPLTDDEGLVTRALGGLFLDQPSRRVRAPFDLAAGAPVRWEPIPGGRSGAALLVGGRRSPTEAERPALRLVVDYTR